MTEEKINDIVNKIVQEIHPEKVILFGSQATGTANEDSDIDLLVIWDTNLKFYERNIQIQKLFPRRNFSLDVFAFTPEEENKNKSLNGNIINEAHLEGKILYVK